MVISDWVVSMAMLLLKYSVSNNECLKGPYVVDDLFMIIYYMSHTLAWIANIKITLDIIQYLSCQ